MEKGKIISQISVDEIAEESLLQRIGHYFANEEKDEEIDKTTSATILLLALAFVAIFISAICILGASSAGVISHWFFLLGLLLSLFAGFLAYSAIFLSSVFYREGFARKWLDTVHLQKKIRRFDKKHGFYPRTGSENNPLQIQQCWVPYIEPTQSNFQVGLRHWDYTEDSGWQTSKQHQLQKAIPSKTFEEYEDALQYYYEAETYAEEQNLLEKTKIKEFQSANHHQQQLQNRFRI